MPGAHSRLSPSSAHRWRKCPGAPRQEEGLPDSSGIEAAYGTVFHEYGALCLELGLDPQVFVGAPCETDHGLLFFDQQMADNMLYGLDYLRDFAAESEAAMYVEQKVDLSPWLGPDEFGTSDCCIINKARKRIIIFDWKYGIGVPVSPIWNDQAILYGLGCWQSFAAAVFEGVDPAEIEVVIVIEQPRAPGGGGVWYTNMATLLREGGKIKNDAKATLDPDAEIIPGEKQCQFCRAAKFNTCKPRAEHKLKMFDLGLEEIDEFAEIGATPPLPKALTPEQRSYILTHRASFTSWLDSLHAEAYDDAMKGRPVPRMKLVYGRYPPRKWKDEEKSRPTLERALGDKAYTRKLVSPTQLEEAVGKRAYKERFAVHVDVGEPKPELVSETDRRDPIPDIGSKFDALMEDDNLV